MKGVSLVSSPATSHSQPLPQCAVGCVSSQGERFSGFRSCRCFVLRTERQEYQQPLWSPFKFIVVFPGKAFFKLQLLVSGSAPLLFLERVYVLCLETSGWRYSNHGKDRCNVPAIKSQWSWVGSFFYFLYHKKRSCTLRANFTPAFNPKSSKLQLCINFILPLLL